MNNDQVGYVDENGYEFRGNGIWYDATDGSFYDERTGVWTYPTSEAAADIATAATSGSTIGSFTNGLMQLGYTAAQIAMLYQNVKSSAQTTPATLAYLQQENAYLKQRTGTDTSTWMIVGVAGLALLFLMQNSRRAA